MDAHKPPETAWLQGVAEIQKGDLLRSLGKTDISNPWLDGDDSGLSQTADGAADNNRVAACGPGQQSAGDIPKVAVLP